MDWLFQDGNWRLRAANGRWLGHVYAMHWKDWTYYCAESEGGPGKFDGSGYQTLGDAQHALEDWWESGRLGGSMLEQVGA